MRVERVLKHFLDVRVDATVLSMKILKQTSVIALVMLLAAASISAQKILGSRWDGAVVTGEKGLIEKEFEKRMKARK